MTEETPEELRLRTEEIDARLYEKGRAASRALI